MIQALEKLFIRPSRHYYRQIDLGPQKIKVNNTHAYRKDTSILNKDKKKIQISMFLFEQIENTKEIVIYCHCNSGSKVEGIAHAKNVLEMGFAFLVFDFTGSGLSEGDYITLGLNQSKDIESVVNFILKSNPKIKIGLWGRSMGAVASLIYLNKHPKQVQVAVFDSPFSSLKQLCLDIGTGKTRIPKLILEGLVTLFSQRLKLKTKQDLFQRLDAAKIVQNIWVPGLFLGSRNDSLIPFKHIQLLYQKYAGYKQIYYLQQDHHEKRSQQTLNYALKYISKRLKPTKHKKSTSNLLVKDKHHFSQADFRYSFQNKKKLQLSYLTTRKQKTPVPVLSTPTYEKKKFIQLTQLNREESKAPKKIKLIKSTMKPNKKPNIKPTNSSLSKLT